VTTSTLLVFGSVGWRLAWCAWAAPSPTAQVGLRRQGGPCRGFKLNPNPAPHFSTNQQESVMLQWALIFFVVSLILGFFGFSGMSAATAGIAKILFYIAIVIFLIFLVLALMGGALVL
jgi:uncharacterized membrane protein YtjA (UPF0391 family)